MKRLGVKYCLILSINCALFWLLNFSIKPLPPLGKVLSPFSGVWVNGLLRGSNRISKNALDQNVEIQWDDNGVPHIFAINSKDLYFAQGYLHAMDRLFQMDVETRVGGARISELVGEKGRPLDSFFIKIGMRESARQALSQMMENPKTKMMIESYVSGVNSYIDELTYPQLPVEYKLLNKWPEKFDNLRVANFLKLMTFNLAGKSLDLELSRVKKVYGLPSSEDLFRDIPSFMVPIVPDNELLTFSKKPKNCCQPDFESVFADYPPELNGFAYNSKKGEGFNGSNNWAVDKSRSETHENLLANDTHLSYSLPNIWYEMQIQSEEINVYGASFPGSPGVIIGHNQDVAWGVTNATMDVMDFYQVNFKDETYSEYYHEGQWKPTQVLSEKLRVSGQSPELISQIWTHHGVVVATKGLFGLVMKWIAHKKSNELIAFADLAKAKDFNDCWSAIEHFFAPAQNFICMDRDKFGLRHNGKMPVKRIGQGKYIMDGSLAENDWQNYVPFEDLPQVLQPKNGYVFSANQTAVSDKYEYYMGWYYDDHFRSGRIKEFIESKSNHTVKSMQDLQNDEEDLLAREILPIIIRRLDLKDLTTEQLTSLEILKNWDFSAHAENVAPSLFYYWWKYLRDSIWADQLWGEGQRQLNPRRSRTLDLIKDVDKNGLNASKSNLYWLDDINTPESDSIEQIVTRAFLKMWSELVKRSGQDYRLWEWHLVNPTQIPHLANIPGLGTYPLKKGGSYNTPNANTGSHGASWKMIVKLGKQVEAWTNLSGGVSGNPMDKSYEKFVEDWRVGRMKKAQFWLQISEDRKLRKLELRGRSL